MSVTGAIMAGVGLAGSIGGAAISSNAAGNAATTQANAADQAAQLQYQASQNALDFQKQQYSNSQAELAPWLQSGSSALTNLDHLLGLGQPSSTTSAGSTGATTSTPLQTNVALPGGGALPSTAGTQATPTTTAGSPIDLTSTPNTSLGASGSLMAPYPGGQFTAPTAADMEAKDPGYQARLALGTQALQQSAAARGNLLTGGTAEALNAFAQNYASNEYSNYYNQAYNTYASNYNQYEQQQTNEYNRLASLAGVGQQTASTLGSLGTNTANNVTSNLLNTANSMGQDYQNAAAANASGVVGSANAWSGALGGASSSLSNLLMLSQLNGGNQILDNDGAPNYG